MKTNISSNLWKSFSISAAILLLASVQLQAATVVDLAFNPLGPYTEVAFSRTLSINTATEKTWNWDASNKFFNGDPSRSWEIYGGVSYKTGGTLLSVADTKIVNPINPNGRIWLRAQETNVPTTVNTLLLWDSADFLVSGNSVFDGTTNSSLSINFFTYASPGVGHFVIRDGSDYYVSNKSFTGNTGNVSISGNTAGLTWATFDPSLFAGFNGSLSNVSASSFSVETFNDVTGVGFLAYATRPLNGAEISANDFTANLIPEPSTTALVGLGGLAVLALGRRRSRS